MKKLLLILVVLLLIQFINGDEIQIPVDKQMCIAEGVIISVGTDIITDALGLSPWLPFATVTVMGFGKELLDEDFNWNDITSIYVGFSFGFVIRYIDSLQYKKI